MQYFLLHCFGCSQTWYFQPLKYIQPALEIMSDAHTGDPRILEAEGLWGSSILPSSFYWLRNWPSEIRQFIHSHLLHISSRYGTMFSFFDNHLIIPTILPYLRKIVLYKLYCLLFLSAFNMYSTPNILNCLKKESIFFCCRGQESKFLVLVCFKTWQLLNFWHLNFSSEKLR